MKWAEIDLKNHLIKRKMSKTRRIVEIPILPPLMRFLHDHHAVSGENEYVLPEHAAMYMKNPSGISWRVKSFLESLGITTTRTIEGRSRAVSIKDVHSLRHTFCYYAGVYGIPFLIVKDIVGHVSPQMTELYQKHADNSMKREKLMQMPDLMGLSQADIEDEPQTALIESERDQLIKLANEMPLETVKEILGQLQDKEKAVVLAQEQKPVKAQE